MTTTKSTISPADLIAKPPNVPRPDFGLKADICAVCGIYASKKNCLSKACKFCCKTTETFKQCPGHSKIVPSKSLDLSQIMTNAWEKHKQSHLPEYIVCQDEILLVGSGADELFGGYSRYNTSNFHEGLESWRKSTIEDLQRLWTRNLGRDDRCAVASGCTNSRHPYLDPSVVDFVANTPSEILKNGNRQKFATNKALLRELSIQLGLNLTARFKKRAVQFGSRSALCFVRDLNVSKRSIKGTDLLVPI